MPECSFNFRDSGDSSERRQSSQTLDPAHRVTGARGPLFHPESPSRGPATGAGSSSSRSIFLLHNARWYQCSFPTAAATNAHSLNTTAHSLSHSSESQVQTGSHWPALKGICGAFFWPWMEHLLFFPFFSFFALFQLLEAAHMPWLVAPTIFKASKGQSRLSAIPLLGH